MPETVGKCAGCGACLAILVGEELKPVTNSEWAQHLAQHPDFRNADDEHCLRCGKRKRGSYG